MSEQRTRVGTYRILLPPPWVRVPLREGTEEAVTAIVDRVAATTPADIPPDQVGPRKRELIRALLQRAGELRDQGGLDLYLPVESVSGFMVRASFTVSEVRPPGADAAEASAVTQVLAREPGADLVTTRGIPDRGLPETTWVRRRRVIQPDDGADPALLVDYTTPVPGAEQVWLLSSFSCSGTDAAEPEGTADMLSELFTAIMLTWRWELDPAPA
jgi:hypothetical protein